MIADDDTGRPEIFYQQEHTKIGQQENRGHRIFFSPNSELWLIRRKLFVRNQTSFKEYQLYRYDFFKNPVYILLAKHHHGINILSLVATSYRRKHRSSHDSRGLD